MSKLLDYVNHPSKVLLYLINKNFFFFLSDKAYLELKYRLLFGKRLDLSNPHTFNEKMQWLKLNDHKDIYSIMVDKYKVKEYVSNIIGEEYIIPTLGIFDNFDDIDFNTLPNQFVIKCTHDSGGLVIVKDKCKMDLKKIRKKINKSLKSNYYKMGREWPYKNVEPKIIIEKYMEDDNSPTMKDYKFFCFNGMPKIMYLSEGLENHKTAGISFYDMDFKLTDCKRTDYKQITYNPPKPKTFELMKKFSKKLSKGIPHLRVDFYEINGHLFFGELTFFTCSGFVPFADEEWDKKLGSWIKL